MGKNTILKKYRMVVIKLKLFYLRVGLWLILFHTVQTSKGCDINVNNFKGWYGFVR